MKPVICCTSLLLAGLSILPVYAQDIPYRGNVTSADQGSGLTWECIGQGASVQCDFIQTLVRQEDPLTPAERTAQIEAVLQEAGDEASCDRLIAQIDTARAEQLPEMDARSRQAFEGYAQVLESFCGSPSATTAEALIDFGEQTKARSCKIGTLPFKMAFTWNGQSARWESVSAPEGGCGIVTMVFLEQDKEYRSLWNYREISLVTNKTGTDALRGDCSVWPEDDTTYRWQPDTLKKTCEFVSFGF